MGKMKFLNSNILKIIAAISMLLDHIGLILFPHIILFRILGRIAFPIFAFSIAEGCKYTKNKLKYFLLIFSIGLICQIANYLFNNKNLYMCALITFSISILLIYLLQFNKHLIFNVNCNMVVKIVVPLITTTLSITTVFFLNKYIEIDYGFWGCMLPLFISICDFKNINVDDKVKHFDNKLVQFILTSIGVLALSLYYKGIQFYSLISLLFILLYNQQKGHLNLKYFFYIFYPLHLVVLYVIALLINFI